MGLKRKLSLLIFFYIKNLDQTDLFFLFCRVLLEYGEITSAEWGGVTGTGTPVFVLMGFVVAQLAFYILAALVMVSIAWHFEKGRPKLSDLLNHIHLIL